MWHLWSGCLHAVWKEAVRRTRLCRRWGEARGTSLCRSRWAQVGYIRLHLWWWWYTWCHRTHWRHGTFHGRLHWIWKTYFKSIIPAAVSLKNVNSCKTTVFPQFKNSSLSSFHQKESCCCTQFDSIPPRILLSPQRSAKMLVKKLDTNKLPVNDPTELGRIRLAIVFVNRKIVISTAVKIHFNIHLETDLFHNVQSIILIMTSNKFQEIQRFFR